MHTNLPKEIEIIQNGIDEPTYYEQAYNLDMDLLYYGFITNQSEANYFTDDYDVYDFNVTTDAYVNINVGNISVSQLSAAIIDETHAPKLVKLSNALSQIDSTILLPKGKYFLVIQATPYFYSWKYPYSIKLHSTPATSVENNIAQIKIEFYLYQNYPNPFNSSTYISFHLPSENFVSLKIYDILGRNVAVLISEEMQSGDHTIVWDATGLPSGTYFYSLQSGNYTEVKKLVLLK